MKRYIVACAVVLAATSALAQSSAQSSFDKLKALAGTWTQKGRDGMSGEVTYRVVSGGSAVMADMSEHSMVSMFAMDGSRLLMTHYCGAGNQPRMVGTLSPDGKTLTFDFLDATNLDSPQAGHMHHAVFTFVDANHYTEDWTFAKNGQNQVEHMELQRKN
ncbi:MAG TPA: hypothetical protein VFA68_04365 [Terriglobales bacterium]|nr:hypothetical protein [Terriglobales bacterium]